MDRFSRFADVIELDDSTLRLIVDGEGDAPERLWAAWAIALRRPSDAGAVLEHASTHEPSEGVRAHLALMLVAHGERTAALALALHDPAALVRASAWRCLSRVATPADAALNDALAGALGDPAPDVRVAALDGLRVDAPESLRRRAAGCLADTSLDVRAAAVEYLLRAEGFSPSLREHAPRERDEALFATIIRAWIAAEGSTAVVRGAVSWSSPDVARLLGLGVAATVQAGELEAWLTRADPAIDLHLSALDAPLSWLLAFAVRYARLPADRWTPESRLRWTAADRARRSLGIALAAASPEELEPEERRLVRELASLIEENAKQVRATESIEALEALAVQGEDPWDADDEGLDLPWVFGLELLSELRRLAATPTLH